VFYNTVLISVHKMLQKEKGLPTSFKSIFERKRVELKAYIKVDDILLDELEKRHILTPENISHIKVSY